MYSSYLLSQFISRSCALTRDGRLILRAGFASILDAVLRPPYVWSGEIVFKLGSMILVLVSERFVRWLYRVAYSLKGPIRTNRSTHSSEGRLRLNPS